MIFAQPFFLSFRKKIKSAIFNPMFKTHAHTFPLGTFIPTPLRVIAIAHLCIAFSILLFDMGYPFMGQLFEDKRLNLMYESVFQDSHHFQQLPYEKQTELRGSHQTLLKKMQQPFLTKLRRSFSILFIELPPFQKAWIFFSLVIPLLILLKIDGAHRAAWLLPLIAAVFFTNQLFFYPLPSEMREKRLFPSETVLLDHYLKEPLASSITDQRQQLLKGWHLYLIDTWAKEAPASDDRRFKEQLSKALFAFNAARIDAVRHDSFFPVYLRRKGGILMMGFLAWNLFFAWFANRRQWF